MPQPANAAQPATLEAASERTSSVLPVALTRTQKVAGATAGSTGIECSSCHDPHNKQAVDDLFLRGTLTGNTGGPTGYICLKCHQK